jgi:hypothetical protein
MGFLKEPQLTSSLVNGEDPPTPGEWGGDNQLFHFVLEHLFSLLGIHIHSSCQTKSKRPNYVQLYKKPTNVSEKTEK